MVKKVLKIVGIILAVLLAAFAGLVVWLTVAEYKPDAVEDVEVWDQDFRPAPLVPGESLTILSQNTGYAGLGKDADFFMDGGKSVAPTGEEEVTLEDCRRASWLTRLGRSVLKVFAPLL